MTGAVFWDAGTVRFEARGVAEGKDDMVGGEVARGWRHPG